MAKKAEPTNRETAKQNDNPPNITAEDRKNPLTAKRIETVVAILLGITTLLSAWAAWIGSLHGGIQSINFTKSNHMASQGTAEYNLDMQLYLADYMAWNTAKDYYFELESAKVDGNQAKIDLINEKIRSFEEQNASEILVEGVKWMEENHEDNPFKMPGMAEKYFASAQEKVDGAQELLEEGMRDNTKGDAYRLVTVIYSLTLFLLGIVGTFQNMPNRIAVLGVSVVCLVFAFVYMCSLPLPTGFAQMNFFEFGK